MCSHEELSTLSGHNGTEGFNFTQATAQAQAFRCHASEDSKVISTSCITQIEDVFNQYRTIKGFGSSSLSLSLSLCMEQYRLQPAAVGLDDVASFSSNFFPMGQEAVFLCPKMVAALGALSQWWVP